MCTLGTLKHSHVLRVCCVHSHMENIHFISLNDCLRGTSKTWRERHNLNNWHCHTIIMYLKVQRGKLFSLIVTIRALSHRPSEGGQICVGGRGGGGGVELYVRASSSAWRGGWHHRYSFAACSCQMASISAHGTSRFSLDLRVPSYKNTVNRTEAPWGWNQVGYIWFRFERPFQYQLKWCKNSFHTITEWYKKLLTTFHSSSLTWCQKEQFRFF